MAKCTQLWRLKPGLKPLRHYADFEPWSWSCGKHNDCIILQTCLSAYFVIWWLYLKFTGKSRDRFFLSFLFLFFFFFEGGELNASLLLTHFLYYRYFFFFLHKISNIMAPNSFQFSFYCTKFCLTAIDENTLAKFVKVLA